MMGTPPLEPAVNEIVALPFPAIANKAVGAAGIVAVTTNPPETALVADEQLP